MTDYGCTINWGLWAAWFSAFGTVITGIAIGCIAYKQHQLDKKKLQRDIDVKCAVKYYDTYIKIEKIQSEFEYEVNIFAFYLDSHGEYKNARELINISKNMKDLQSYITMNLPNKMHEVSEKLLTNINNIATKISKQTITLDTLINQINDKDTKKAIHDKYLKYTSILRNE